jgi:hypothetical protein
MLQVSQIISLTSNASFLYTENSGDVVFSELPTSSRSGHPDNHYVTVSKTA